LQAFDVFVFPSLYEGLPVSLIEAQAACLPCIISSNISDEVVLTPLIKQVSLDDVSKWVEAIELLRENENIDEEIIINNIKKSGYDIKTASLDMQEFYLREARK